MKPGKSIPRRDTAVQPAGEIARRLAGLTYVLTITGGGLLILVGLVQHRKGWLLTGGGLVGIWVVLHFLARRRLRLADLVEEVGQNPFKPERAAPSDAEARSADDTR